MYAKYWLVFQVGDERRDKPFATLEGMERYIKRYKRFIKVIAKTQVLPKPLEFDFEN
jgi:hypothetical protein